MRLLPSGAERSSAQHRASGRPSWSQKGELNLRLETNEIEGRQARHVEIQKARGLGLPKLLSTLRAGSKLSQISYASWAELPDPSPLRLNGRTRGRRLARSFYHVQGSARWRGSVRVDAGGAGLQSSGRFALPAAARVVLSRRPLGKEASALRKTYFEVAGFISCNTEAAR